MATPRRSSAERQAARERGVDRFNRPMPRELAKTFDPFEFRCYRCGARYELPDVPRFRVQAGGERVVVVRPAALTLCARFDFEWEDAIPYAYKCRDEKPCRERERVAHK